MLLTAKSNPIPSQFTPDSHPIYTRFLLDLHPIPTLFAPDSLPIYTRFPPDLHLIPTQFSLDPPPPPIYTRFTPNLLLCTYSVHITMRNISPIFQHKIYPMVMYTPVCTYNHGEFCSMQYFGTKIDPSSARQAHFMLEKRCICNSGHLFAIKYNTFVLKLSHGYMYV